MKNYQGKDCLIFSLILYSFFVILPEEALALPVYERLFRKKYKYRVSCYICHSQGGGSAPNSYGKGFKRRGMNFSSFGKMEDIDSDKDGFKNLVEILVKSNPGSFGSTPENPGDWLRQIEESFIPREQLLQIYPEASYFTTLEGALNEKQIRDIESTLGRKLSEQETIPTFYFAFTGTKKDAKRIGLAMFASPPGKKGRMYVGIGIALNGSVNKLVIYKNKEDQKVFRADFLSQFEAKTLKDSFAIKKGIKPVAGEEELSAQFSESVRLSLLTMFQVFAR